MAATLGRSAPSRLGGGRWQALIGAATGVGTGYTLFAMTGGLFIPPMQQEFGWSRSAVTISPAVSLIAAVLTPFYGAAIDRWGSRIFALAGMILLTFGYIGLALVGPDPAMFITLVFLIGIICPLTTAMVWVRGVATWFDDKVALPFALAMSGVSVVAMGMTPLLAWIIETYGWRAGFVAMAVCTFVVGLPVAFFLFRERAPADRPRASEATAAKAPPLRFRQLLGAADFWRLMGVVLLVGLPIGAFMGHLQPLLQGRGFAVEVAASLGSVFAATIVVGRLVAGALLDRFRPSAVAATFLALPALGAAYLAFTTGDAWLPAAACVALLGLAQGAEADFLAYFAVKRFAPNLFGKVFGILASVLGIAMGAGGFLFSSLYDAFGDYSAAAGVSIVMFLGASSLIACVDTRRPLVGG